MKGLGMRRKCRACENVARAYLGAKVNVAPRIGVSMRENVARAYLGAYAYACVCACWSMMCTCVVAHAYAYECVRGGREGSAWG